MSAADPASITSRAYDITTENGEPLAITRYEAVGTARGVVLIVPAMSTPASYYGAFAKWLTTQGLIAYTFDYQGFAASARGPLSGVQADLLTWASDAASMLQHVVQAEEGLPVHWVGHSLGGQLLPFADHRLLSSATILCSGTGYWRHAEGRNRILAPLLWYAIAPTLVTVCGFFPGRRIHLLGDVPGPAMRQWITWCRNPDYILGVHPEFREKFASVEVPLTSISVTDDDTMSAIATAQLESWYTKADLATHRYVPREVGLESIGHLGIVRPRNASAWSLFFAHLLP